MVPGHQRIRFTCLKSQTMAELEKTSTDKASRGLEDLRAFKNNFKVSFFLYKSAAILWCLVIA